MRDAKLPHGFLAAGANVGIKNSKRDAGVLISDSDAVLAACVTTNRSRAPNTARLERLRDAGGPVRAVLTVSGNANALTGEDGVRDDEALAATLARQLGIEPEHVLTAYTGVVGHRLPVQRIEAGLPGLLADLSRHPTTFAESVLTTDRTSKIATREIFVAGTRVQIQAVAKGSGMIAPAMATMLCFVATDAVITQEALQEALSGAVDETFNQLTIDQEMSTNDAVLALANGQAENTPIETGDESHALFVAALREMFEELSRAIADDGEGATRRIDVEVHGAATEDDARLLARAVAGSMLVKAAAFGADPNVAGRVVATAGAAAARAEMAFDLDRLTLRIQGETLFSSGSAVRVDDPVQLRHRLTSPVVHIALELGEGRAQAVSWGCDLTYDYVKINADYAAITQTSPDGRVAVNERLAELGPSIKKKLLVEALRYIDQFKGIRAVIKLGGAAMIDPKLEQHFADDVVLLRNVGLEPIVVHGGGPEISRTMERLGQKPEFINGLRVTDHASMGVVEMVLTGSVNQRLVAALNRNSSRAVGLSGKDGGLIRARKVSGDQDLGQVGEVESVDPRLIDMLEQDGYIPVVSPVGLGDEGLAYNINADIAAAEMAVALKAEKLIFLSDVAGLMEGDRVVSELNGDQLKLRLDEGEITGGMRPKMEAALRALRGGIASVHLVDGRVQHNLIAELFTDRGVGTLIRHA